MKAPLWLFILSTSYLVSCKSKGDKYIVDPDFASTVAGDYSITTYEVSSDTLHFPYQGMTGTFTLKKIDLAHVQASRTLRRPARVDQLTNSATYDEGLGELRKVADSENTFNLYIASKKVGRVSPNTIKVIVAAPNQGGFITITAKR